MMKGVLIGAGFFAQFQAEAWKRMASMDLAAVADIATRPDTHLALTQLVASRGIHVICQKPMAPTMAECEAMCAACEAAGVRLLIHENWRWQPWYREAKRLIDSGALGTLKHLSFDWRTGDGIGPEPYAAQPYFRTMPRLLIYESLVHILDTFRLLGGELSVTACETRRVNPVIAGEDWAEIQLTFASGATGFIHGDRQTGPASAPVAMGSMVIEGKLNTLRIASDGEVFLTPAGAATYQSPVLPAPPQAGGWKAAVPTGYKGDSVFATQAHLLHALQTGAPSESDGRDYLRTVSLVEACYQLSDRRG